MKTTKKTLWKLLLVLAAMCLSIGSTIAYLTDSDGDVNVMTLGRVEIDLIEQERVPSGYDDFHDDHPLIPGVYKDLDVGTEGFWPDSVHNAVDKIVSVGNIGNSDAYVRLWFAFEVTGEEDFFEDKIHLNKNENSSDWTWEFLPDPLKQGDERYVVAVATHPQVLTKDEVTPVSLRQVLLDCTATNEDVAALGEKYSILVVAQGVQASGFTSAEQALTSGFGEVTLDNHPFAGMTEGEAYVPVTKDGLEKVLNNTEIGGKQVVSGVTFGRVSEYSHVVEQVAYKPVEEQTSGSLPMLFATAYADDEGDVTAYYVPSGTENGQQLYHVYILSEGSIKLHKSCEEMALDMTNLKIFTATNLDASDVQQMQNFYKGCNNLTVVKVPEGVKIIPEDMFADCDNLSVVEFPESVEKVEINPQAFKDKKEDVYLIVVPGSAAEQWGEEEGFTTTNWPFIWWNMGDYIHIEKYIGTAAEVEVPAEIEGLPVEVLGANAFAAMEHMDIVTSVKLPETIRSAQYGVFIDCNNLRSINIPASLQRIPDDFLTSCTSLESITIPRGVIKLESGVFTGCTSLKTVSIPDTVTHLGYDVFYNCTNLESVTFSSGLIHIGARAFSGTKITTLTLPDTVTWLANSAFAGMDHLQELIIPASVTDLGTNCIPRREGLTIRVEAGSAAETYCKDNALPYTLTDSGSSVTPEPGQTPKPTPTPDADPSDADHYVAHDIDNYTIIERYEDFGTPATNVDVPGWLNGSPVRVIGSGAFSFKKFLETVTLPEGLWEIKFTAFNSCEALTSVYIPDSVNNIGREAFAFCGNLQSITIPKGLTSLNDGTFRGCRSLKEVTIPGNILRIEREAFSDCSTMETVTIEEGVQSLAAKVFANCTSLKTINIPKSVTSMGNGVFDGCPYVQVTVYQNTTGHEYCVENGIPYNLLNEKGEQIQAAIPTPTPTASPVPEETPGPADNTEWHGPTDEIPFTWYKKDGYAGIQHYEGKGSEVVVPSELGGAPVRVLGLNAFAQMEYITKVTLPETLTTIEGAVFPDAKYMTECNIPASVTFIGDGAFFGCNALKSVTIPAGVTEILASTFGWCESLTTVTIPGNVKSVGNMAFHDCHGLTEVVIENGVQTLENQIFSGCKSLESVKFPMSIVKIGANIFMDCPNVIATVYQNSTAHTYCEANSIPCIVLDEDGNVI